MLKFLLFLLALIGGTVFLLEYSAVRPLNSEPAVSPLVISGIVVPHHDLVKTQRAELFNIVASKIKAPKTVIIVSPNHYEAGQADVQTTDKIWELFNGTLEPDVKALTGNIETGSFQNEHGIYTVLPDIKRVWPKTKVIPIILKFNASVDELTENLQRNCAKCLLVASVDFSHYQPAVLANLHDELSLRALQNLDEKLMREKAEVDSPASLQLLMRWAKIHNTTRFNLVKHTNSGELLNNPDIETTSHMFGWYGDQAVSPLNSELSGETAQLKQVSFLIGGDMMFARGIHYTFRKDLKQSVARLGDRLFWGTDLALINLEGMVSRTPVVPDPRPTFNFIFPPETVDVLKWMRINAVSIDNNHANGVRPTGIPSLPVTVQGEGLKITVIGVNALWEIPSINNQIANLKSDPDQRVIIFPHWGTEYAPKHNTMQERLAHEWIDAGADMIVGAHSHVIQDGEIYKGKPIFYSLGNLLFDQDWSRETQEGMLIGGKFTEDGLKLFGLPVISNNFQPELARGELKLKLLKKIEGGMIQP